MIVRDYSHRVDKKGRTCSICSEYKEYSNYHRDLSTNTGFNQSCKLCISVVRRLQRDSKDKKCASCGETKPKVNFHFGKHNCKQCATNKRRSTNNPYSNVNIELLNQKQMLKLMGKCL